MGPKLSRIQILHLNRLTLFQSLLQFQRKQTLARRNGKQSHWAALLSDGVTQAGLPPADRLHEFFKYAGGGLGVGKSAVGGRRLDSQSRGKSLQAIAAAPKAAAGDADGVHHGDFAQHLNNFLAAAAEFLAEEGEVEADVVSDNCCAVQERERGR
jgi:hypothetical protein